MTVILILAGFLIYSVVLVPILMELALDKTKKRMEQKLSVKKSSFVMRIFYKDNLSTHPSSRTYPVNGRQFYMGVLVGGIIGFLTLVIYTTFVLFVYAIMSPFTIVMGYMPNLIRAFTDSQESFVHTYEYERIGSKKWIAPWKFIVPIGIVFLIYLFRGEIYQNLISALPALSSKIAIIVYGSIAVLIFLIILINNVRKKESSVTVKSMKEIINSCFKIFCKNIEVKSS